MEEFSLQDLKESRQFMEGLRWDITPKIFAGPMKPESLPAGNREHPLDGFMLYVDLIQDRPAVLIIKTRFSMSKTIGYIEGVPEDLLREAMKEPSPEAVAGMYPLTDRLTEWLKKGLGLA